ncbi:uncharacterized protein HMPREF1541_02164 [Cyphellophora europaea CBS 101466]|uniref:Glucose-methanol-choline oxidoreductase N-terminal domain-containing protein n=1 Tax=Cyphellophora europaea (strain CBS 101466) TaxID=1220924 RepID=W2S2R6_CYPE1|nr:uncharacterized protein HMPREF1541_02164 [Cyphellophora europaea CBS 101466]ETN43006.1 hypothetical protein HMPREF1541_02164 [Cyphellophora europaea CBS 101466]
MFGQEKYDWCLRSVPQAGLNGREVSQTRGKLLGGSSAIDSHSPVYPNRGMHDAWAGLVGDQRGAWEGIEDCYKKFQHVVAEGGGSGLFKGPVKASLPLKLNRLQQAWHGTFKELNATATDALRGQAIGGTTTTNAIDNRPGRGERSHAGNAYLTPANEQANLTVRTVSLVEKIALRKENSMLRAEGVYYMSAGQHCFVEATKEVILCAGVFSSPQLLELSGIGQRAILDAAGVQPVHELQGVGENLQDHLNYGASIEVRPEIETMDIRDYDPSAIADQQRPYHQDKTRPLAEGSAYSFAYLPLQLLDNETDDATLRDALAAHKATHPWFEQNQYIYDSLLSPKAASATVFMTRKARYTSKLTAADGEYTSIR